MQHKSAINFSFIIPHKNIPNLLRKCVDSIPRRADVQIIVVDDNSDPTIVNFEHFPIQSDDIVEVVLTKEGKGAGYARNIGLEHAVGKWVVFADADDFFEKDLETAMDKFVSTNYDVVFFKTSSIQIPSGIPADRNEPLNGFIDVAIQENDYVPLMHFTACVARFIRRNFITQNQIRFHETRWANDVFFWSTCIGRMEKIVASPLVIYCYTDRQDSLVKDTSIACLTTRVRENWKSMYAERNRCGKREWDYYWRYQAWFNIYKRNKIVGGLYFVGSLFVWGKGFLSQVVKSLRRKYTNH